YFDFYSQKINIEKTSQFQEKYFESMRFKSLHLQGRQKSLHPKSDDIPDEDGAENVEDTPLRLTTKKLIPLIEEADDDEEEEAKTQSEGPAGSRRPENVDDPE